MAHPDVRGLWHVALRVTDLRRSRAFYEGLFGLQVIWAPDQDNLYLSSGSDNLALHQIASADLPEVKKPGSQFLDHLGFIMSSPEAVDRLFKRVEQEGITIVHRPKRHRDGSYSFYVSDPDGNTVQVLHVPNISNKAMGDRL